MRFCFLKRLYDLGKVGETFSFKGLKMLILSQKSIKTCVFIRLCFSSDSVVGAVERKIRAVDFFHGSYYFLRKNISALSFAEFRDFKGIYAKPIVCRSVI